MSMRAVRISDSKYPKNFVSSNIFARSATVSGRGLVTSLTVISVTVRKGLLRFFWNKGPIDWGGRPRSGDETKAGWVSHCGKYECGRKNIGVSEQCEYETTGIT
jgi:hypothetical protein